jgi:hypothetical protein
LPWKYTLVNLKHHPNASSPNVSMPLATVAVVREEQNPKASAPMLGTPTAATGKLGLAKK